VKSIKVSEAVYEKLKRISTSDKLTISEAVEKLLSTFPLQGCGGSGGNQDQGSNSTFYRRTVENGGGAVESRGVESGSRKVEGCSGEVESRKVEYVTRDEFNQVIEDLWCKVCDWSEELLKNLRRAGIDLNEAKEDQGEN